jgi:hypothetical protein
MDKKIRRVSAFGLAARPGGFSVEIDVEHVLEVRPNWSRDKAKQFLNRHGAAMANLMVSTAMTALLAAAEREDEAMH